MAAGYSFQGAVLQARTSWSNYNHEFTYPAGTTALPVSYHYENGVVESIQSQTANQLDLLSSGSIANLWPYSSAFSLGNFISDLRLSPHTRLLIEVDYHGGINFGQDGGSYSGTSLAELSGGGTFDRAQLGRNDEVLSTSHSDTLSLTLTNSGTVARKESISLYSYAAASYIVPVPEPAGYAILGLGLLLLGVPSARRKPVRPPDYLL